MPCQESIVMAQNDIFVASSKFQIPSSKPARTQPLYSYASHPRCDGSEWTPPRPTEPKTLDYKQTQQEPESDCPAPDCHGARLGQRPQRLLAKTRRGDHMRVKRAFRKPKRGGCTDRPFLYRLAGMRHRMCWNSFLPRPTDKSERTPGIIAGDGNRAAIEPIKAAG